jgi:LmbE family N-acetylglucosaminyl deacetylase
MGAGESRREQRGSGPEEDAAMTRYPSTTAARLGTILSIWAHPDDETYLSAGVMADAVDRGQRVVCVSFSAGERGTSDPVAWPPARLGPVRRWEAAASMAVLGVDEHVVLGFPDGALADHDARGLAVAGMLLDDVEPDTILTFGPDGVTYHPDHVAVHRWVTEAWDRRGRRSRLLYATKSADHVARFADLYERWDMYMSDERPTGVPADELALHVPLYGRRLDRKLAALAAMASQTQATMAKFDPATFALQVAEESFVDAERRPAAKHAGLASLAAATGVRHDVRV